MQNINIIYLILKLWKTVEKPENLKNNIVENKGIEEKFDAPIESVEKIEPIKMEKIRWLLWE